MYTDDARVHKRASPSSRRRQRVHSMQVRIILFNIAELIAVGSNSLMNRTYSHHMMMSFGFHKIQFNPSVHFKLKY